MPHTKSPSHQPEGLTIEDVSRRLQLGLRKVRELLHRTGHPLPAMRLGHRTYRITERALEQWLREESSTVRVPTKRKHS